MTFDVLADRCLLFVEERKQMIIALLKEAELEMTRKCNMYEDRRNYACGGEEYYVLPTNYKQIILFQHDGDKLESIAEDDISYDSDGTIPSGTPTGYYIRNNGLYVNATTSTGTLRLSYYGTVDGNQDGAADPSPVISAMFHRALCDYAIAISAAKDNPQLHDKHWMMWNNGLNEIINQDADRELIHTIKREV